MSRSVDVVVARPPQDSADLVRVRQAFPRKLRGCLIRLLSAGAASANTSLEPEIRKRCLTMWWRPHGWNRFRPRSFPAIQNGDPFMDSNPDVRITKTPVEARGGFLGRPVLVVLLVSTLLVIGLFTAIYAGYFS
jgi:hypothetical protein